MAYELHAHVAVPVWSTDNGNPAWIHPQCQCRCVIIDSFSTLRRAQRAAENLDHVWVDSHRMVPKEQIKLVEIHEVP